MATKCGNNKEVRARIVAGLDIAAEYRAMGLRLKSDSPRASGKIEAWSISREEAHASAWIDTATGLYGDSGPGGETLSIFDFAIKFGGYANFSVAWEHFAKRANVELPKRHKKKSENPNDKLEFEEWYSGNETLAKYWAMRHKKGTSLEAIKLAGGRIAHWPCWENEEGQKQLGKYKCISLPCYGPQLTASEPVAWVLYNITGAPLEIYRGKGQASDSVKMVSVGPTAGTLMNPHALERLAGDRSKIERVWFVSGPSDALSLFHAIPPELRDTDIVLCGAAGETANIANWVAELLAGLKIVICFDADEAGQRGAEKCVRAFLPHAAEVRRVMLPYEVTDKHGRDIRDYLCGV